MEVVVPRGCGLDVHKKSVVAAVRTPQVRETRTFGTYTRELRALMDWLTSVGVTDVVMEGTGVYWRPVYNVLEEDGQFNLLVVNAAHVKKVPGRKTDVSDAEWLGELLRFGLVRGSFIPSKEQREQRDLLRYRKSLVEERTREVQRVQKILETANIKLASVATDVAGVSGRRIIAAMVEGIEDPEQLAGLALGRLKEKEEQLKEALVGLVGPHQRFLLGEMLDRIKDLDKRIERLDAEVERQLHPHEEQLNLLQTIPGVGLQTAELLLAEIGTDMTHFPTAGHLVSWAGFAPGQNESGGKRRKSRTRKGSSWLRAGLVQAAWAAIKKRDTYLSAQYHRLAHRRGPKRAAFAVAHTILVIAYHILLRGVPYQELGPNFFDRQNKEAVARRLARRLEALGYEVMLKKPA